MSERGPLMSRRSFSQFMAGAGLAAALPSSRSFGAPPTREMLAPSTGCIGEPVHVTSSALAIPSNASTGVNALALVAPNRGPMLIDEVKFKIRGSSTGVSTSPPTDLGGVILVTLIAGKVKITGAPTPAWSFGRADNLLAETRTGNGFIYSEYRWRLAQPLYVAPGGVVIPSLQNVGLLNIALDVVVSYSGRELPAREALSAGGIVHVPYVSPWLSKALALDGSTHKDNSTENDLSNLLGVPVHVQHITGRAPVQFLDGVPNPGYNETSYSERDDGVLSCVRFVASNGIPLVRDSTSFRQVFSRDTRSWNVQHDMPPKTFYQCFVSTPGSISGFAPSVGASIGAHVAIVGWRDMKVEEVW